MERDLEASEPILDHNNCEHTGSQDNTKISNVNKRTWSDCERSREENAGKKFKTTQICTETEVTSDINSPETAKNDLIVEDIEANELILENTVQKLEPTLPYVPKNIAINETIFQNGSSKVSESVELTTSINDKNIEIMEVETPDNENNIHNFETELFNLPKKEHDIDNIEEKNKQYVKRGIEANHDNDNNNKEEETNNNETSKEHEEIDGKEKVIEEIIKEKEEVDDNIMIMKQNEEIEEKAKEEMEEETQEHGDFDDKERDKNKEQKIIKDDEKNKEETTEEKVDTANKEEMKNEETAKDVEMIQDEQVTFPLIDLTDKTGTKHIDEEISPKNVEPSAEKLEEETQTPSTPDYLQKSEKNSKLIQTVLKHQMASYFQNMFSLKPYTLNLVQKGSFEYRLVEDLFLPTSRNLRITKLERVENPYLLGMYLLKKEKMERQGTVQEKTLFHGTQIRNIDGICKYNFDWRRCGQSRGHKFGQGVSFSPQVSYARHYTHGDNVMILAKVLVSNIVTGDYNTVVPTEPYDTTRNQDENVLVKYEDDDFYPQYVIYYQENLFDNLNLFLERFLF